MFLHRARGTFVSVGNLLQDFDLPAATAAASAALASASAQRGPGGDAARQQQAAYSFNAGTSSAESRSSRRRLGSGRLGSGSLGSGVALEGHVLPTAPGQAPLDPELAALAAATPSAVDWRGAYGLDPAGGGPRAVVGPVKDQVRCGPILHLRHRQRKGKDTRLLAARKDAIFLRLVSFSNSKIATRVNRSTN